MNIRIAKTIKTHMETKIPFKSCVCFGGTQRVAPTISEIFSICIVIFCECGCLWCLCVSVHMWECSHTDAKVHVWRSKGNPGYQSLPSTLFETRSPVCTGYPRLAGLRVSGDSPVCFSSCCGSSWMRRHTRCCASLYMGWEVIWAQVSMLAWQAFYMEQGHLPGPIFFLSGFCCH